MAWGAELSLAVSRTVILIGQRVPLGLGGTCSRTRIQPYHLNCMGWSFSDEWTGWLGI